MTDFKNAKELLKLCETSSLSIADVMRIREKENMKMSLEEIEENMRHALNVMRASAHAPLSEEYKSRGRLIGGESRRLNLRLKEGKSIYGDLIAKAVIYSQAVLEVNSSMGVIVAAPTAGASGIMPAILFALEEVKGFDEATLLEGLFTAGAIGYLFMRNASVAGAEAGCQAEVGSASAMAAAAIVAMFGGTPKQSMDAASIAVSNLLGLVCDPVAGLVEIPCQSRNALAASNAFICAEMVLSGIEAFIPFSEMIETMYQVGRRIPVELRETSLGGCAVTKTACKYSCKYSKE